MDLSHVEAPFSIDEIKGVVFQLGADKGPGPNGIFVLFLLVILGCGQNGVICPV